MGIHPSQETPIPQPPALRWSLKPAKWLQPVGQDMLRRWIRGGKGAGVINRNVPWPWNPGAEKAAAVSYLETPYGACLILSLPGCVFETCWPPVAWELSNQLALPGGEGWQGECRAENPSQRGERVAGDGTTYDQRLQNSHDSSVDP